MKAALYSVLGFLVMVAFSIALITMIAPAPVFADIHTEMYSDVISILQDASQYAGGNTIWLYYHENFCSQFTGYVTTILNNGYSASWGSYSWEFQQILAAEYWDWKVDYQC